MNEEKIKEIMALVDDLRSSDSPAYQRSIRNEIESKLRELLAAGEGKAERTTLSNDQISDAAHKAYMAGNLSWAGFEKDERGVHCVPILSKSNYDLVRAVEIYGITQEAKP